MQYTFKPTGVCSQAMVIEINEGTITHFETIGGCNGNLKGIGKLVEGMKPEEVIKKLKGIKCGFKNTSCPDQLAIALEKITKEKNV